MEQAMSEKTEWELVEPPQPRHEGGRYHHGSHGAAQQDGAPQATHFLQAMLGRWWQLKLLGAGIAAVVALALLIMIGGVLVLTVSIAAVTSFGIARLGAWLRGKQIGRKTYPVAQGRNPWQQ
jgi:hypothetical protein